MASAFDYHCFLHCRARSSDRTDQGETVRSMGALIFCQNEDNTGQNYKTIANSVLLPTRPFDQKIVRLPLEASIVCLIASSALSPRTSASTSGASGYTSFLN